MSNGALYHLSGQRIDYRLAYKEDIWYPSKENIAVLPAPLDSWDQCPEFPWKPSILLSHYLWFEES